MPIHLIFTQLTHMPIRTPPRREPRVLAAAGSRHGLRFAVVDPWEVRSAGLVKCDRASRVDALRKLIRREKPTALAGTPSIRAELCEAFTESRLGVVTRDFPTLPPPVAADLYPELVLVAPKIATQQVVVRAIAAVLHANIPTRHYETLSK